MDATKARSITKSLRDRLGDGRYIQPIMKQQQQTQAAAKVSFPSWISKVQLSVPSNQNVSHWLGEVIRSLGNGDEIIDPVSLANVDAEWIGTSRFKEQTDEPLSELGKYNRMMDDVSSNMVLLFLHGGAF